jgi:hypothetical protein
LHSTLGSAGVGSNKKRLWPRPQKYPGKTAALSPDGCIQPLPLHARGFDQLGSVRSALKGSWLLAPAAARLSLPWPQLRTRLERVTLG